MDTRQAIAYLIIAALALAAFAGLLWLRRANKRTRREASRPIRIDLREP
jgi:type II secretory pathway component PulJ